MPLTKTTFLIFFTASKSLPPNPEALYRNFLLLAVANMPVFPFPFPPFLSPLFIPSLHPLSSLTLTYPCGTPGTLYFQSEPFPLTILPSNKNLSWNPSKSIPFLPACFHLPFSPRYLPSSKVESKIESALDFSLFPAILKKLQTLINTRISGK